MATIKDTFSKKCWCCGEVFGEDLLSRKTYHHAIPRRLRPISNIKVAVCQSCHYKINDHDAIYKKAFMSLKSRIDKTIKYVQKKTKQNEEPKDL